MADIISSVSSKRILKAVLAMTVLTCINLGCCRAFFSGEEERQGAVCFALDCSVSMAGESLDSAKEELRRIAMHIPEGTKMSLVSFRREAEVLQPLTALRSEVINALDDLTAAGKTGISEGLKVAASSLRESPGKKMILLFTDGRNGEERIDRTVPEMLKENGITLFVCGMTESVNEELKKVAEESGGAVGIASDPMGAEDFFEPKNQSRRFFLLALPLECLVVALPILIAEGKEKKKKQGKHPLPNAGYIKKEEIRKML